MKSLDAIFSPKSLAVIGASSTPGKVGHDIFENILTGGFTGTLYPVNPKARSIKSVRAYPSVSEIPDEIDLGMIILSPELALKSVEECIGKGVKGIVIVSAGFREVGAEGRKIEDRIVAMCSEAGIRVVGPNCLGVINPNPNVRLNASFSTRMPSFGNISFISQSGALCTAVLDYAADRDFGFSKFISIGNKADVSELDLLKYFHQDEDTEVIMIYVEELRRGMEFIEEVKAITSGDRPTPILVIKSGRTSAGAKAAMSHTGALAGSEAVYDAIFHQSGIIRVDSINDLFDYAGAFTFKSQSVTGKYKKKLPQGNRLAIVTNAGGPGIVATDMTVSSGLQLAKFKEETVETLASYLPETANLNNPVDVIGDAASDRYEHALAAVIRDEGVDGAVVILTPQSMTNVLGTAEAIVKIAARSPKPILCCFMGIIDVSVGVKFLQENGVPTFRFPEDAAKAFGALYRYSKWLNRQIFAEHEQSTDRKKCQEIVKKALKAGKTYIGEIGGLELLQCYGFNTLQTELVKTAKEAVKVADKMGFPVVMKIVSDQIIHKSDAGGVEVGLQNADEIMIAYDKIMANAKAYDEKAVIDGVLIQAMAPKGQEVIMGMNRYDVFGPLLMFGYGGIFVEVFQDVSFRLAPIRRNSARRMIRDIKAFKLLNGFRGKPKTDIETLEKLLVGLSNMVCDNPEIQELDINPLLVHPQGQGATVADCRILLKPIEEEPKK
ncbi:MAG: acetate--CoA ligase family protein [Desulfobacterales bacterium]|nr:acetate--CoA ligase family protein [Desulfobacterales bacterium]